MPIIAALFLVVLGISVLGLRSSGGGPHWPFLVASTISGAAVLALVAATVIALTAGGDTWNNAVSGSRASEALTLVVVLILAPLLLATCLVMLIIGAVLRTRWRRHTEQSTVAASR